MAKLGELVDLVSKIGFGSDVGEARDILGQVYEYFLGEFASAEGKKGGQFYTPPASCKTLVAVLAAPSWSGLRPLLRLGRHVRAVGEGSSKPMAASWGDVSIYGQEFEPHHLAAGGDEPRHPGDGLQPRARKPVIPSPAISTLTCVQTSCWPTRRSISANWWRGSLEGDPRWVYGTPPAGNANYAVAAAYALPPQADCGRAGVVLANGSMSSTRVAKARSAVPWWRRTWWSAMVALPGQLFFNTQIPACLWFLAKSKARRQGEVLFIDARKLGTMVSRVQCASSVDAIAQIADTFHAWKRGREVRAALRRCRGLLPQRNLGRDCRARPCLTQAATWAPRRSRRTMTLPTRWRA